MKTLRLLFLNFYVAVIWYFVDGQNNCSTERIPIPQEDLDECIDPKAYAECVYEYSNIVDVKKFAKAQFIKLPEDVFCAYKCMAERCGMLTESGFLVLNNTVHFPALKKNYTSHHEVFKRLTEECFETFKEDRIQNCIEFQAPLICFDCSSLVGSPIN